MKAVWYWVLVSFYGLPTDCGAPEGAVVGASFILFLTSSGGACDILRSM